MSIWSELKNCGTTEPSDQPIDLPALFDEFYAILKARNKRPSIEILMVQWRFPRSRKRRIRTKWAKDFRNYRMYQLDWTGQPIKEITPA